MGNKGNVGWHEGPRDAGLDSDVRELEEKEAVLDRERGFFQNLEGGAPVGKGRTRQKMPSAWATVAVTIEA